LNLLIASQFVNLQQWSRKWMPSQIFGFVKRKEMPILATMRNHSLVVMLMLLFPFASFAQDPSMLKPAKAPRAHRIKGEKPNQSDVLKIDLLQVGVNEVRVLYEHQIGKHSSLEFGAGMIYKNAFWFPYGGRPMFASGGGVYFAFRRYMDKKKYFSEPKLRSYFSPMVFYRYSSYQNQWLALESAGPIHPCELISENIHQAAIVLRFGWQTDHGRLALDFYTGLGFKFTPSTLTLVAITEECEVCEVNSTTTLSGESEKLYPTNVIFNGGVKLGIRRNNKERHYDEVAPMTEPGPDPETPPKF
jgi:hypothetical protein